MTCRYVSVTKRVQKIICVELEEYPKMDWFGKNKMENGGFQQDVEEGTELGLVKIPTTINGSTSPRAGPSGSCRPEVCQTARRRYQPPDLSDSPWHRFKTVSLIATIVLLIIWIVVYTVLSQMKIV